MTDRVDVSVLMVTWNSAEVLPVSLAALGQSNPQPRELIVFDNASVDESASLAEAMAPGIDFPVYVLRSDRNLGFAAGMNRAIHAAAGRHVFLHNPDLRVTPEMIGKLDAALAAAPTDVYAVGPKLLRAEGSDLERTDVIDSVGIRMTGDGRHFDRGADQRDVGQYDEEEEIFGFSGAAVMFQKQALEESKVDGEIFDEDFFAYREDADLAWRMRGFGYRALYEPKAVGYHRRRVTPERRRSLPKAINRHSVKNRFLLRMHHADRRWLAAFGLRSLARDLVVVGACLTIERSSFPALTWLVRNAPRHLRRRRQVLKRRNVASADLLRWFR